MQVGGTDATAPVFGGYECQKEASWLGGGGWYAAARFQGILINFF